MPHSADPGWILATKDNAHEAIARYTGAEQRLNKISGRINPASEAYL